MLRKATVYALDRLLRERFGGKVSKGLALISSRRRECPGVRNFFYEPIRTACRQGSETLSSLADG